MVSILNRFKIDQHNIQPLLLYALKTIYNEIDLASFCLSKGIIPKKKWFEIFYAQTKNIEDFNIDKQYQDEFQPLFLVAKRKFETATASVQIGRISELLANIIFSINTRKNMSIFKKMISNIFAPGIDLIVINYHHRLQKFIYRFFEIKGTIENLSIQMEKVRNWYKKDNFTEKYVNELELMKAEISRNQKISEANKRKICQDFDNLAESLVNERKVPEIFSFCSAFFFNRGLYDDSSYNLNINPPLNQGTEFFFKIEHYYENIKVVFKCLKIKIN